MESSIKDIPAVILRDIFLRLPVKSVLACRCVCKTFDILTRTPDFLSTHLTHTIAFPQNLFSFTYSFYLEYYTGLYYTCPHYTYISHTLLVQPQHNESAIQVTKFPNATQDTYSIIGCCNGLFCARVSRGNKLLLWNPVTKQSRYLPYPQGNGPSAYFFGFVHECNEYKVVKIIKGDMRDDLAPKVEVYRMSSDCWSIVENTSITVATSLPTNVPFDVYSTYNDCWDDFQASLHHVSMDVIPIQELRRIHHDPNNRPFLKGAFHWIELIRIPMYQIPDSLVHPCFVAIVSFDLKHEKFVLIDVLSRNIVPEPKTSPTFGVLNESLCLIVNDNIQCGVFNVWLMTDYGKRESWTKHINLTIKEDLLRNDYPIGCWSDFILLKGHSGKGKHVRMYNMITHEWKSLPVRANYESFTYFSFVESLAPVSADSWIAKDAVETATLHVSEPVAPYIPLVLNCFNVLVKMKDGLLSLFTQKKQ